MKFLKPSEGRFWEIDAARGIAVLMMIAFHFLFDLNFFLGSNVILSSGFWLVFARATLVAFLLLVGISLSLSYDRNRRASAHYLKRGLRIFIYGLIITAVTFTFLPQAAIWFGVLHCIGISIILSTWLLPSKRLSLILGIVFIAAGALLTQITLSFPWLLWLGFYPAGFYTFDYVPLLPWFGVVFIGIWLGKMLYPEGKRIYNLKEVANPVSGMLAFLGRHSLLIYLLHQPILVAVLLFAF